MSIKPLLPCVRGPLVYLYCPVLMCVAVAFIVTSIISEEHCECFYIGRNCVDLQGLTMDMVY